MSLNHSQIQKEVEEVQAKKKQLLEAKIPGFYIPRNEDEWRELPRRAHCNNIHQLKQGAMDSGSRATDTQFLCYRALCKKQESPKKFIGERERFGITPEIWEAAGSFLTECEDLKLFLDLIENKTPIRKVSHKDDEWPRSWALPKLSTEHITSTPDRSTRKENLEVLQQKRQEMANRIRSQLLRFFTEEGTTDTPATEAGPSSAGGCCVRSTPATSFQVHSEPRTPARGKKEFPDVFDESIVNTYIVQLLELLSLVLGHHLAEWTMDRVKLEAWFDKRKFTAYTDGALQEKGDPFIQGAIEVKKGIREPIFVATTKQEISQVVAMVKGGHQAVYNRHWLLVGQDRHEIYLNFSHCSKQYLNYIQKGDTRKTDFLHTEGFGPWVIDDRESLQDIIQTLLALTLIANVAAAKECIRQAPPATKRQKHR